MVAFFVLLSNLTFATQFFTPKIDKANEALTIYDYFKAKKLYTELQHKKPVEANFGLAVIYSRKDNPFSNLDSAFLRIKNCIYAIRQLEKSSEKKILLEKQYTQLAESLFVRIDNELYHIAQTENSIESYKKYQSYYAKDKFLKEIQKHLAQSKLVIGQIEFANALQQKNSSTLIGLSRLCDSSFCMLSEEVKAKLPTLILDLQFMETAAQRSIQSYQNFRKQHPNTRYETAIDDSIYSLATQSKTEKSFYDFTKQFPQNKNVAKAWQIIYNSASNDNSPNFFKHFLEKYPEYPFIEQVAKEYKLSQATFYKIRQNKLFGFCDENGVELIKPSFDFVDEFSEGLCVVSSNGKYAYIHRNGNLASNMQYDEAEKFSDGLAIVKKNDEYHVITKKFESIFHSSDEINDYSDGFAVVKIGDKFGYINQQGSIAIEAKFENAYDFKNGYAVAERAGKVGLINKLGEAVIPFEYEWIDYFSKEIVRVQTEEKVQLFQLASKSFVSDEFDFVDALSDGLAAVYKEDKLGYIDSLGNYRIQPQFEAIEEAKAQQQFENGFALVSLKGKNIVIDKTGKRILPSSYQSIKKPSDNLIAVKKKNKWGYVDVMNEVKIKMQYQEASRFKDGFAIVKLKNKQYLIDSKGSIKQKIKQQKFEFIGNNLLIIEEQNKRGLYDSNFQLLLSDVNEIKPFKDQLIIIEKAGKMAYFRLSDRKIIWQEEGFTTK